MSACQGRSEARERVGFLRCWDRNFDMATAGQRRGKSARFQEGSPRGYLMHSASTNVVRGEEKEEEEEEEEGDEEKANLLY